MSASSSAISTRGLGPMHRWIGGRPRIPHARCGVGRRHPKRAVSSPGRRERRRRGAAAARAVAIVRSSCFERERLQRGTPPGRDRGTVPPPGGRSRRRPAARDGLPGERRPARVLGRGRGSSEHEIGGGRHLGAAAQHDRLVARAARGGRRAAACTSGSASLRRMLAIALGTPCAGRGRTAACAAV